MTTEKTKTFPLRVVLTVTTYRLLTESRGQRDNGIMALHEILEWMTDDAVWTHQLPRFGDECKPWLLRWFPELKFCNEHLDELDALIAEDPTKEKEAAIQSWLARLKKAYPSLREVYQIPRIPADDHERKNAYDELVEKWGPVP